MKKNMILNEEVLSLLSQNSFCELQTINLIKVIFTLARIPLFFLGGI